MRVRLLARRVHRPSTLRHPICIAPSILSANFAKLGEDVHRVIEAGADMVHFDVMDNHYVPNLTVGPLVCKALRDDGILAPIDVHLMVSPVDRLVEEFAEAGATHISFHPEASDHPDRTLSLIRERGCKPGLAFNPATPLHYLDHVLEELDQVLIMSVNPGFPGQAFIAKTLDKLTATRELLDTRAAGVRVAVDGGIKVDNVAVVAAAGADTLIAGSAIFGADDYAATIASMRKAAASA